MSVLLCWRATLRSAGLCRLNKHIGAGGCGLQHDCDSIDQEGTAELASTVKGPDASTRSAMQPCSQVDSEGEAQHAHQSGCQLSSQTGEPSLRVNATPREFSTSWLHGSA